MTADSIKIRALAPGDRPDWAPLWAAYLAFYGAKRLQQVFDSTFARYTDLGRPDMKARLAWDSARGKGVARHLIETVYRDADDAGRPSVYWLMQTGNADARRLYDRIATPMDFMKYAR